MLEDNTLLLDRYRVVRLLSSGGMGAVYEAFDERLNCTVALKKTLFDAAPLRTQFEREARILARLRHPALTKVIDHFTVAEGQFLVMEFIPGPDLHQQLREQGRPFPVPEVLVWSDQLLDALDYLHGQSPPIVHRDIKPQNLKLSGRNEIVLLDFGLAKDSVAAAGSTTSASLFGYTPNYAPLEQVQGTGTDPRSDLYSFGASMYELVTATVPPDALTRAGAAINGEADPLRPPEQINPEVSAELSAAILAAMQLSRDRRPSSARELRAMLRGGSGATRRESEIATEMAPTRIDLPPAPRAGPAPPTVIDSAPAPSSRRAALIIAALLLLALFGGSYVLWKRFRVPRGEVSMAGRAASSAALPVSSPHASATTASPQVATTPDSFVLDGRTKEVNAVTSSPDGSQIVTGTDDGVVIFWDTMSRRELRRIAVPGAVSAIAFAPDGRTLAVGISYSPSLNKSLARLIDLTSGATVREWFGEAGLVSDLAWSRDGRLIAFVDGSRVRLVTPDGKSARTLELHSTAAGVLSFSRAGDLLASGGVDGRLAVWDTTSGKPLRVFEIPNGVRGVAFSPDGRRLAAGGYDETLRIYDPRVGQTESIPLPAFIDAIDWSPDGAYLAVAPNVPGRVDLLATPGYALRRTLTGDPVTTRDLTFTPDSRRLVATSGKAARVWVLAK